MTVNLTELQADTLSICIQRQKMGKSVTVAALVAETGLRNTAIYKAFTSLRVKGFLILVDDPHYRAVRDAIGAPLDDRVHRRITEDGVEVTQCPPMPARGYGLHSVFDDW